MKRYLQSPGYDPAWGQPVKGGTFYFGAQSDGAIFHPINQRGCYTHGCFAGLPTNSLFRIDPWQGDLTAIEGDLVESWDISDDGLTLTMRLRQGVMFIDHPSMPLESTIPVEFDGERILGDEFVCEDAKATYERYVWPPDWETRLTAGKTDLGHLESVSCPDGGRGHTFVMHFSEPRAKTLSILAGRAAVIFDKDYIVWLNDWGKRLGTSFLDNEAPDNFYSMHGTGPFVPYDIDLGAGTTFVANPNYWREGLPLLDQYKNVVIKDIGSRFTALATGKIHYMGEGSWSMTPRQAAQAVRDFPDRIVINNQLNNWARTIAFGSNPPWNDVRVRRAISLAIDRDGWSELYRIEGYGGMRLAHTMPPGTYYAPSREEIRAWPGYRQPKDEDVAEANRLMDEVFGAGSRPTAMCVDDTAYHPDLHDNLEACKYLRENLRSSLRMIVTVDFLEPPDFTSVVDSGNFDLAVGSYVSSIIGDPDDDLYNNYILETVGATANSFMQARWQEQPEVMQQVEDMIRAQSSELDPVKRKDLVRELDLKILNEISQYVLLGWNMIFPAWRVELKGWKGYDLYSYTKYAMNERMWLPR